MSLRAGGKVASPALALAEVAWTPQGAGSASASMGARGAGKLAGVSGLAFLAGEGAGSLVSNLGTCSEAPRRVDPQWSQTSP